MFIPVASSATATRRRGVIQHLSKAREEGREGRGARHKSGLYKLLLRLTCFSSKLLERYRLAVSIFFVAASPGMVAGVAAVPVRAVVSCATS